MDFVPFNGSFPNDIQAKRRRVGFSPSLFRKVKETQFTQPDFSHLKGLLAGLES
ncbi:uncharacterized protein G2W53_027364 [Senna tora]|uniref:Uncharacterized protein n=1 Tax=Senna tora TaxID=362788 RepID=A0A834TQQ1_9FABA|nr:uncharacterized protein G2W53_027364 [Senna tora]